MYEENPELAYMLESEIEYCMAVLKRMRTITDVVNSNPELRELSIFRDNQRTVIKQMIFLVNHIIGCKKTLGLPYGDDDHYTYFLIGQLPAI